MPYTDIQQLSQAIAQFYRHANDRSADYNVRRVFMERALIYKQIHLLLLQQRVPVDPLAVQGVSASTRWYKAACHSIEEFDNLIFLELLEHQEASTLSLIKTYIKQSDTLTLSQQLAKLAAHLQISHDACMGLKERYRHQQRSVAGC